MKIICPQCNETYQLHGMWESAIKDFPENKEKIMMLQCPRYLKHHEDIILEKVKNTPIEVKQKLLNLIHAGKTIGEARTECNIELMVACEIINQNLGHYSFLNREAK